MTLLRAEDEVSVRRAFRMLIAHASLAVQVGVSGSGVTEDAVGGVEHVLVVLFLLALVHVEHHALHALLLALLLLRTQTRHT